MIFSISDHIKQIKNGEKTQTRRLMKTDEKGAFKRCKYRLHGSYAIQPGRAQPGIPDGRIKIDKIMIEDRGCVISHSDAQAEGGYEQEGYERLFRIMYPDWEYRWVYHFKYIQSSSGKVK